MRLAVFFVYGYVNEYEDDTLHLPYVALCEVVPLMKMRFIFVFRRARRSRLTVAFAFTRVFLFSV